MHLEASLECPCLGNQPAHARMVHAALTAATAAPTPPIRRYDPRMQTAVLGVRLLLAVVFLAAGIGKLQNRRVSAHALVEFGVPPRFKHLIAVALPLAELSTAVALVLQPSARWGAVAAATLLVTFSAAIANALAHDRRPDCRCFGQIHSAPAGAGTLARNAILLVFAIFVSVRGPGPAIAVWVSSRTSAELGLGVAVVMVLALAVGAGDYWLNQRADKRGQARFDELSVRTGLPVGSRAPQFELRGVCGPRLSLDLLRARGKPVLVVFADRSCCACQELLQQIGRWQQALVHELTVAVITNGHPVRSRELCDRYGIADVLLQDKAAVFDAYEMPATPSAVLVDTDGLIASATASGYRMIHTLVRLALRQAATQTDRWEASIQPA